MTIGKRKCRGGGYRDASSPTASRAHCVIRSRLTSATSALTCIQPNGFYFPNDAKTIQAKTSRGQEFAIDQKRVVSNLGIALNPSGLPGSRPNDGHFHFLKGERSAAEMLRRAMAHVHN